MGSQPPFLVQYGSIIGALITGAATIVALFVQFKLFQHQLDRSDRTAKLQAAAVLLQIRSSIQIEFGKQYNEAYRIWTTALDDLVANQSSANESSFRIACERLMAVAWGELSSAREGLLSPSRLEKYTGYWVLDWTRVLQRVCPINTSMGVDLLRTTHDVAKRLGDAEFRDYIGSTIEAAKKHFETQGQKSTDYETLMRDRGAAVVIENCLGRIDEARETHYRNDDGKLAELADQLIACMGTRDR